MYDTSFDITLSANARPYNILRDTFKLYLVFRRPLIIIFIEDKISLPSATLKEQPMTPRLWQNDILTRQTAVCLQNNKRTDRKKPVTK